MGSLRINQGKRGVRLSIISIILTTAFVIACGLLTPGYGQEYRQIVIATGSPFELGLIDELAKAF